MNRSSVVMALIGAMVMGMSSGCRQGSATTQQGNDLESLRTARVAVGDQEFEVWIAETARQRELGLMFVESEQMASLPDGTPRGMLFVFDAEQRLGFWMLNTIIPLDIAYAASNGDIVKIHTMDALTTRTYPSEEPARYALEVSAGLLEELGIDAGDRLTLPAAVLNP